ncbi:uncharacterized protein EDB91DRAFT_672081 [Suillus paluster]|uniref:uncharacterized protein n=1 Tax=Suillus paluster TaxID=48578 RepID=UPI001B883394|nr:uncharacterized protein EDB91DRAFT_672081 [Suillus paluster]KAG1732387.1 hypothetical protein EDB91DRAFT_672081 [Suillus paluster]
MLSMLKEAYSADRPNSHPCISSRLVINHNVNDTIVTNQKQDTPTSPVHPVSAPVSTNIQPGASKNVRLLLGAHGVSYKFEMYRYKEKRAPHFATHPTYPSPSSTAHDPEASNVSRSTSQFPHQPMYSQTQPQHQTPTRNPNLLLQHQDHPAHRTTKEEEGPGGPSHSLTIRPPTSQRPNVCLRVCRSRFRRRSFSLREACLEHVVAD